MRFFLCTEEKIQILDDLYSLKTCCVPAYTQCKVENVLMQNHSKSKITERLSLPELKDEILQVCHSERRSADRKNGSAGWRNSEGILNVSFLYVKANDEVPFGVWKGMVPFSAMLECREEASDMKYDVTYAVEQLG